MNHIVYITPEQYPASTAMARRIAGISLLFQSLGHRVSVLSGMAPLGAEREFGSPYFPEVEVEHVTQRHSKDESRRLRVLKALTSGDETVQMLYKLETPPDMVVQYGGLSLYAFPLLKYCKRNSIPLVIDVVEWYQPAHMPGGPIGFSALNSELAMRYFFPRSGHIIAISRYLESYYSGSGCDVVRIPPVQNVLDMPTLDIVKHKDDRMTLVYAGSPASKDLLDPILEGVLRVDPEGNRMAFRLVGPSVQDILHREPLRRRCMSSLPNSLEVLGRMPCTDTMQIVGTSDFSVLLRPLERYAMAGFPTKVTESMTLGTPVICNLTSDLADYVDDGIEGLVCLDYSVDAFMKTLEGALSLSGKSKSEMRLAARRRAATSFDYRNYLGVMNDFLQNAWSK